MKIKHLIFFCLLLFPLVFVISCNSEESEQEQKDKIETSDSLQALSFIQEAYEWYVPVYSAKFRDTKRPEPGYIEGIKNSPFLSKSHKDRIISQLREEESDEGIVFDNITEYEEFAASDPFSVDTNTVDFQGFEDVQVDKNHAGNIVVRSYVSLGKKDSKYPTRKPMYFELNRTEEGFLLEDIHQTAVD